MLLTFAFIFYSFVCTTACLVAFGGLAFLILLPKIITVELYDRETTGIVISRRTSAKVGMEGGEVVINVSGNPMRGSSEISSGSVRAGKAVSAEQGDSNDK